jgi:type IV secretory pathway TrbF-like protein
VGAWVTLQAKQRIKLRNNPLAIHINTLAWAIIYNSTAMANSSIF